MIIQTAINSLPPAGGTVVIPSGDFSAQPKIAMRDNVRLVGQGWSTIIPPILDSSDRRYGMGLEHLIVDGRNYSNAYGIDWRNVTNSRIVNALSRNVTYGLILAGPAFYNKFDQLFIDASVCAVEMTGIAAQTKFDGGKWSAPTVLKMRNDVNFVTFDTVAFEGPNVVTFKDISSSCTNIRAINVRQENGSGTAPWNQ